MLATRPDLIGLDISTILSRFQDKMKPFSKKHLKIILKKEYGDEFNKFFKEFNHTPIASASIAQVHKAKTHDNKIVAIKILRPNIRKIVKRDIKTLKLLVFIAKYIAKPFFSFFNDILKLLKETSKSELDLTIEATNCSLLKDNLKNLKGFYVPNIYWQLTTTNILAIEWLDGIAFSDKIAIKNSNHDKDLIAKNLVISYFNQVYKYGFFHGDMHPGNLILLKNGDIGVVDFGIMGIIDNQTRIAIAKIVIGFINKDYNKIAQLHISSGLVPPNVNAQKLALSCRKIGETVVDSKVKDIPIAQLLQNLISMTQDYQMSTKPELLLLQKTILLVEGIGTMLNPNLNIWDHAKPFMKEWSKVNLGFDAKIVNIVTEVINIINKHYNIK
ncbi:MAG: hypothetical protein CMP18_02155 [Rickettsiales bacterium]|jgi:ubiquinone biosynthesis protein|nr:hypothetical protein [Rickettsiales bacterium]|tara:strand:- start:2036 stop:3193 length:1158 start_codon:yes stop_codon:yes gene_type:complete